MERYQGIIMHLKIGIGFSLLSGLKYSEIDLCSKEKAQALVEEWRSDARDVYVSWLPHSSKLSEQ